MPYRLDISNAPEDAFDRLVERGALDVAVVDGRLAAIMPDGVTLEAVTTALPGADVRARPAQARDDGSVWTLTPGRVRVRRWQLVPADSPPGTDTLRMVDGPAFGTGLHPTTTLCLEAIDDDVTAWQPAAMLDVGTGSGILALAALHVGVRRVVAIDVDADAIRIADENARLNGLRARLHLVHGGPEAIGGSWPLVVANVLTAPLVEMAPALARCLARGGRIVLSGVRASLAPDVEQAYRHVGMRPVRVETREDWAALTFRASW